NYNLQNISLYITDASNQSFGLNSTASISGISSSSTWMLELPIGDYSWNCLAHDTSGNSDWGNEDRTMRVGAVIISAPILHSPANGKSDPETKPAFVWYNSTMDKLGSIKYHLQVDDTYDFSSALDVNVAGIVEGDALSNYALTTGLELDTQYYWRVRAYDGIYYSGWSDTWQYYTEGTIALSFIQQNVSFGIMDLGAINDTSDNLPLPFIIRNDGDVFADITINASAALWVAQPLGTKYFQFKAADRNEPGSFNTSGSPTTWNNISLNIALAIKQLDYNNVHDTAVIDILMEVPTDEPAGAKTADINFHAKKST
ncbi:MAG: hypothetical protein KAI26_05975, partial [Nanoarchaeota archaeon]|nr:hypothetical protein [Nanoarchaeota archaeon]